MNNKSKRKLIVALSGALALALVAGTLAYYTSTNTLDNQMKTAQYGNELEEKFTPKEDWQPGEKVDKEAGVNNTGDYDLFVRIKMGEEWTLKDGTTTHGWASSDAEFQHRELRPRGTREVRREMGARRRCVQADRA